MKKCLVCNKEFDDDSLFCPECGTKLVSNDTCPNCGKEVKPGEKYCRYCGKKIKRIRMCPNCGIAVDDETMYCPKCGTKIPDDGFVYNEKPHIKQNKIEEPETEGPKPIDRIVSYIFVSLFAVISILFIVGMFGDFLQTKSILLTGTTSQGISFFFGEGARTLSSSYNSYPYKEYFAFTVVEFVLDNVAYFGGLIGLAISLFFATKNLVKAAQLKEEINHKPLTGMIISVLPYLFIIYSHNYMKVGGSGIIAALSSYGWGTTMLVVAILLMICTILAYSIVVGKKNAKQILQTSLIGVTLILVSIIVMFGTGAIISCNEREVVTSLNSAYYVRNLLAAFSGNTDGKLSSDFVPAIIGYASILLSGITFITSFVLISNKRKNGSLVVLIVALVLYIVGSIFSVSAIKTALSATSTTPAIVGGGCLATYILGSFAIAGLVTNIVISKK